MTTRSQRVRGGLRVLFACIFALVAAGCGAGGEMAPAKSASGASAAPANHGEAEAASEHAPPPAVEAPEAPSGPPSLFDAQPLAQAAPGRSRGAVSDAPAAKPGAPAGAPATTTPAPPAAREPLLVYTATVTLAVFGAREAIGAVEELARASGGYLVNRSDDSVTIRVPTPAFRGALGGLSRLGDELHREVNVRDVTEQFADLEIRLRNAEAVRDRLEALLAKAGKIEDALAVERELERVTQSIEQLKGKLRLLSELVAFSTITVNFRARPRDQVGSETRLPFPWLNELGLVPLMNLEAQ
ncbi:MAG TPA: DUF4349 domain-containing protein [Polyangiaceae bacterium]